MSAQESSVAETSGNHALLFHYEVIDILAYNLQSMASLKWFQYLFRLKIGLKKGVPKFVSEQEDVYTTLFLNNSFNKTSNNTDVINL